MLLCSTLGRLNASGLVTAAGVGVAAATDDSQTAPPVPADRPDTGGSERGFLALLTSIATVSPTPIARRFCPSGTDPVT